MDAREPPVPSAPRRQRRLAAGALLVAVGVALAAFPLRDRWWGGLLLAVAEAGIVGGLADWFAVTALFRRPLGLPIPHTALIPANWELMAARVGSMVGDRVLTRDYLVREIERLDLARLIQRAAEALRREDLEGALRRAATWLADALPPTAVTELLARLRERLAREPFAPLLAWALEAAWREGWDRQVVDALARALAQAADRPAMRLALADLVDDLFARYRAGGRRAPRLWLRLAERLGLIDRDRIVAALRAGLRDVAADPDHPLRGELLGALAELPARLRTDVALIARVEAATAELLASPAVSELLADIGATIHLGLITDLRATDSAAVRWLGERLDPLRVALIGDAALRGELAAWAKRHATTLVETHHGRLAHFIERGIHALGSEGAVRLIEEHAGDDLQYIRLNGTVIGGLAGGAIHALHLLWRAW